MTGYKNVDEIWRWRPTDIKNIYIIKDRHKNKPSKKKDGQKDRQTDKWNLMYKSKSYVVYTKQVTKLTKSK